MVLTALGLGLGWVSPCQSSCIVTTQSNLEMPYTAMVPTIALYHSGVGAVVSPVSFFISSFVRFSFLPYWLAVQNLRIALKKAVFALGFKKPSVITR